MSTPVWLALGSNLGDRADSIRRAVEALSRLAIGPVHRSRLYETAPVGPGRQESYLNLVLRFDTRLGPRELLAFCQQTETDLGRQPRGRWEPREIDIDILLYGREVLQLDSLVVPHPSLVDRQFVLAPLRDLDPGLTPPGYQETISELLRRCIEAQGALPMREYRLAPPGTHTLPESVRYLAVEGAIGVGKTTLVKYLAEKLGCAPLYEEFENNPFLADFYRDRSRFAFQTQMFFLLSRFRQIQDQFQQQDLFRPQVMADYMLAKDRIFASVTLDENELSLYRRVADILQAQLPKPDYVVYLQADPKTLLNRIKGRDRYYERNFDEGYLEALNQAYNTYFHHYDASPLLIVNTSHIDFVRNPEDLALLADQIAKAPEGMSFFNPAVRSS